MWKETFMNWMVMVRSSLYFKLNIYFILITNKMECFKLLKVFKEEI